MLWLFSSWSATWINIDGIWWLNCLHQVGWIRRDWTQWEKHWANVKLWSDKLPRIGIIIWNYWLCERVADNRLGERINREETQLDLELSLNLLMIKASKVVFNWVKFCACLIQQVDHCLLSPFTLLTFKTDLILLWLFVNMMCDLIILNWRWLGWT